MLPHALAVMRQFPFSAQQPGISYLAVHPVSWNEPTILEQRFRPGVPQKRRCLLALRFAARRLCLCVRSLSGIFGSSVRTDEQWTLQPSLVKFLVHGLEFDEGFFTGAGHIQVDFGLDSPFLHEDVPLTAEAAGASPRQCAKAGGVHEAVWKRVLARPGGCCGRNPKKTLLRN